jgi:sugar lactone lactonase YvrE
MEAFRQGMGTLVNAIVGCLLLAQPSAFLRAQNRALDDILTPGKPWDLLGQGYQLTADSAVDRNGNVYFTDSRANRILKIDPDGHIAVWKENSNGAHGIAIGPDGRLYVGQHDRKRIVAQSAGGAESVVADGVQSHHLTVTSRNEIYFCVGPAHQVWMTDGAGRQRVVSAGITWPRGVRATADRSMLVVNDAQSRWVWKFRIESDGSLTNGRPFYRLETPDESSLPDSGGMAFDSQGLLYVATKTGVQVCDQKGRVTVIIDPPAGEGLTNVFFAGPDLRWLYVTDGDRLYRRPAKRRGESAVQLRAPSAIMQPK